MDAARGRNDETRDFLRILGSFGLCLGPLSAGLILDIAWLVGIGAPVALLGPSAVIARVAIRRSST